MGAGGCGFESRQVRQTVHYPDVPKFQLEGKEVINMAIKGVPPPVKQLEDVLTKLRAVPVTDTASVPFAEAVPLVSRAVPLLKRVP